MVVSFDGAHQLTGALAVVVEAHALVLREQEALSGTLVHKEHGGFLGEQVLGHHEAAFPEVCEVILQSRVAAGVGASFETEMIMESVEHCAENVAVFLDGWFL